MQPHATQQRFSVNIWIGILGDCITRPYTFCPVLWRGHLKRLVYDTSFPSIEDLTVRISVAAGEIRDMPRIF
ncbi:hypothetical protein TNCV_438961 [Trichonephila clavipes]|nr:hypothetical protein TNCV_438961 [Trichonephila clavipes]